MERGTGKSVLIFFVFLAMPLAARGIPISSATVSDPHALSQGKVALSPGMARLTVFPEKLVYDVSWGIMSVGQATMGIEEIVSFNGTPAYHVVSEAKSNNFCDALYKVRDFNESWIDARRLESLGYSKKLREGRFFRDEWVLYNRVAGAFLSKKVNRDASFEWSGGTIPVHVQDVLSSLYFIRSKTLEPGAEIILDVNTKRTWPLVVRVLRRETVKTAAGKFSCIE